MSKTLIWSIAIVLILIGGSYFWFQKNNLDKNVRESANTENMAGGCYVSGCSGQICSDTPDVISDCMYKEEYACYKATTCERQEDGQCGWTDNEAFNACIDAVIDAEVNIK